MKGERDPSGMRQRVERLPAEIREAWSAAREGPDLMRGADPSCVLVCGMGGSAIGGDFLRAFAALRSGVPVVVVRGYDLPRFAGPRSFAFFVSYSGNTEETLSAWSQARERGVPRAALTSGGSLAEQAREEGSPCLFVPGGSPPRAALAWTSIPLFLAMARGGLMELEDGEVEEARAAGEEALARHGAAADPLSAWADSCRDGLPLVYAPSGLLEPAALRWATQLNENAKALAHVGLFPEQNHNEIVGFELASPARTLVRAAFLGIECAHPRVGRRMEIVRERIRAEGGSAESFEPLGAGPLARLYSLAVMGDLASLRLAAARDVDPTPVRSIDRLKEELSRLPAGRGG